MELPVREHLHLLSSQFLVRSLQPGHVSHPYTTLDQGPRHLRNTLRSKCIADVSPFLEADGTVSCSNYTAVINNLHTDIVRKYLDSADNNRVLGHKPPPVHKNELHLPRLHRTTLAQLRSGFCIKLRETQFRIGKAPDDLCQNCLLGAQSVQHLFDCPAKPTTLTINDLWENPWGVADFIRSVPEFSDLPPPPPPPPPRRRPPARPPPLPDPPGSPLASPLPPDSPSSIFSPLSLPLSPPPSPFSPVLHLPPAVPPLMGVPVSPPPSPTQDPRYAWSA